MEEQMLLALEPIDLQQPCHHVMKGLCIASWGLGAVQECSVSFLDDEHILLTFHHDHHLPDAQEHCQMRRC